MKRSWPICVLGCILLCSAAALSAPDKEKEKEPRRIETVEGTIKAVDPANKTFILGTLSAEKPAGFEIRFAFDQKTTFLLDSKPSTMDKAMKAGNTAVVTHMNTLALKVEVRSKPATSQ